MSKKVVLKYFCAGFIPMVPAYLLCFHFWWIHIDIHFPTIVSVGAAWVAALYLGVLISRLTYFKELGNEYIGIIELSDTGFLKDSIGKDRSRRFQNLTTFFAASMLILISTIFYFHTRHFERYQLKTFGLSKKVTVEKISFSNGRRIEFEFDYNQRKYYKVVHSTAYEINDTVPIIFSYVRPDIIRLDK